MITGELLSWTAIIHENHCDYEKLFVAKNIRKKYSKGIQNIISQSNIFNDSLFSTGPNCSFTFLKSKWIAP